jgi:hypothetical protein
MSLVSNVYDFGERFERKRGERPEPPMDKKRLAAYYRKSPRWVEMRVNEGMPSTWDATGYKRYFNPAETDRWLAERVT